MWAFLGMKFSVELCFFSNQLVFHCKILLHIFNMTAQQQWFQQKLVKYLISCTVETKGIFGSCLDSKEVCWVRLKRNGIWSIFCCTGKREGTGGGESYHASLAISHPNSKKILFSSSNWVQFSLPELNLLNCSTFWNGSSASLVLAKPGISATNYCTFKLLYIIELV